MSATLEELGVKSVVADLLRHAMHLMGAVRLVDRDLAYVRAGGVPEIAVDTIRARGYELRPFPSEEKIRTGMAHNFVTLAPRKILMPAGNPITEKTLDEAGITTITAQVDEITKAAGAIACMSGILARDREWHVFDHLTHS